MVHRLPSAHVSSSFGCLAGGFCSKLEVVRVHFQTRVNLVSPFALQAAQDKVDTEYAAWQQTAAVADVSASF